MHRERNSRAFHTIAENPLLARPTDAAGYQGGHCHEVPVDAATCPASAASKMVSASER